MILVKDKRDLTEVLMQINDTGTSKLKEIMVIYDRERNRVVSELYDEKTCEN